MKTLIALVSLFLGGCLHVEKTTPTPITGVLLDEKERPISDARIWALFQLPGGIFAAPRHVAFGPAITRSDGSFTVALESVTMIQTGTVFDGNTRPSIIVLHRGIGGFMMGGGEKKKDIGFLRIVWRSPPATASRRVLSFEIIDQLPQSDQIIARSYLSGR
jgi:hypothetical protein